MTSEQRERLLERHRYINVSHDDWYEGVYAVFKEDMKAIGVDVWSIFFSGFSSQGDGACFQGGLDDTRKYLDHHHQGQYPMIRKLLEHESRVYAQCKHLGRYYHHNCTEFWVDAGTLTNMVDQPTEFHEAIVKQWQKQLDHEVAAFEKDIIEQWRTYMQDLYRKLEAEYDYLTSDEAVWEAIGANELDQMEEDYDEVT